MDPFPNCQDRSKEPLAIFSGRGQSWLKGMTNHRANSKLTASKRQQENVGNKKRTIYQCVLFSEPGQPSNPMSVPCRMIWSWAMANPQPQSLLLLCPKRLQSVADQTDFEMLRSVTTGDARRVGQPLRPAVRIATNMGWWGATRNL